MISWPRAPRGVSGSSIQGAGGSEAEEREAKLLVFDTVSDVLAYTAIP